MERGLGYDTPAKRQEALSKQVETLSKQLQELPISVKDATRLAGLALCIAYGEASFENPQDARRHKDIILRMAKTWNISLKLRQWIANLLEQVCDIVEKPIK